MIVFLTILGILSLCKFNKSDSSDDKVCKIRPFLCDSNQDVAGVLPPYPQKLPELYRQNSWLIGEIRERSDSDFLQDTGRKK